MTTNAERIKLYKKKMEENGFKRLSIWVHPELLEIIGRERRSNECFGRVLERLILNEYKRRHGDRWWQGNDLQRADKYPGPAGE